MIFANEKEASECADIDDPTLRLSCYDSLFRMQPIENPKLTMPEKKKKHWLLKKEKEIKKEKRKEGLVFLKEKKKKMKR